MNGSLVPANTKKSTLILGIYRFVPDLLILLIGIAISIILLLVFSEKGTTIMIVSCIPMIMGAFLTAPIPNYHNVLGGIQSIIKFYQGRRNYIWRGWCLKDEFKDDKQ